MVVTTDAVNSAAVSRAMDEIRSRRFECKPCGRTFKNESGYKGHMKLVVHPNPSASPDVSPAPTTAPAAVASSATAAGAPPDPLKKAPRPLTEAMIGHLIGLFFVCFAILLASKAIALTDDEESQAGEIWHPIYEDYKDDPRLVPIFQYLPLIAAFAATCTIIRKKYEGYKAEKATPAAARVIAPPAPVPAAPVQ